MKEKRKEDLIKITMEDLSNKPCIPKGVKYLPLGVLSLLFGHCIFLFEVQNSFNGLFTVHYGNLKSDWEKNEEDHEKIENAIFIHLVFYFFYSYFYIFIVIYMIFKKNFLSDYLPYMGGNNNSFGFLILLRLLLKKVISINYLIFFPIINHKHKAIIQSYFNLISFSLEPIFVIIIKSAVMCVVLLIFFHNCAHDDLFELIKKEEKDEYVLSGEKYFNAHKSDKKDEYRPLYASSDNINI